MHATLPWCDTEVRTGGSNVGVSERNLFLLPQNPAAVSHIFETPKPVIAKREHER